MFEKEAEEKSVVYVDKLAKERHFEKGTSYTVGLEEGYDDGFKDGAEFGYNKANEWHYVKDGDLPKVETWVIGFYYGKDNWHKIFYRADGHWWGEGQLCQPPYAWKEIVLPELKESE